MKTSPIISSLLVTFLIGMVVALMFALPKKDKPEIVETKQEVISVITSDLELYFSSQPSSVIIKDANNKVLYSNTSTDEDSLELTPSIEIPISPNGVATLTIEVDFVAPTEQNFFSLEELNTAQTVFARSSDSITHDFTLTFPKSDD